MNAPAAEITVLEPAGIQAEHVRDLFDGYLGVAILVFILVLGAFTVALRRAPASDDSAKIELTPAATRARRRAVGAASALTLITLVVLLVMSVVTGRALASLSSKDALSIQIVGRRWWWEVTYVESIPANMVRTAYEVHVPVGRPVELRILSSDVIHSLWVPNLGPKRDLIPGKNTTVLLRADRAGTYDGMCAEYCGLQHANMRIRFVADPPDEFQEWLNRMRAPARAPITEAERHGQEVFLQTRCVSCHAIRGAGAFATVGPDLTHLAARPAIAMGTLANDSAHLRDWLVDPQRAKPGVIMPPAGVSDGDVDALVSYLRSLE